MAVVNEESTQIALGTASPKEFVDVSEWGNSYKLYFDHTRAVTGDANSYTQLVKLPAGRIRVVIPESVIATSAFGALRTMDVGFEAYTGKDGVTVAANDVAFDTAIDVSSAATTIMGAAAGVDPTWYFNSRDGVMLVAKIEAATAVAANTMKGYFTIIGN